MTKPINIPDVAATGDVFDAVAELSDSYTVEEAIAMREALNQARGQLDAAVGLVNTQIRQLLDSPRQVGSKLYFLADDGKYRPDHKVIRAAIVSRSVADENGELRTPDVAAALAYELTMRTFVMPSSKPKKDGLDRLGLTMRAACNWEKTGTRVQVRELEGPEDE